MKKLLNNPAVKFVVVFLLLFLVFYYFNIYYFAVTTHTSQYYNAFLAQNLDYIKGLRLLLLDMSTGLLNIIGFTAIHNDYVMLVSGHGSIEVVYKCLGLGVISFFVAFVMAYPKQVKAKIIFIIAGIIVLQILNVIRFMLLAVFWTSTNSTMLDHHSLFNFIIYLIVAISLYFWVKEPANQKKHAPN